MKKLLLLPLIILALYSCKKNDGIINAPVKETTANSWIVGTWNVQSITDTIYNSSGKVTSVRTTFTGNSMTFKSDKSGYTVNNKPFSYDLTTMILNIDGVNYKIIKVSDAQFNLTVHDYTTLQGSLTEYIKVK